MFESDKLSYCVSEFFEKFKDQLPKIVIVEQGFHGEILTDTFDRDQVIRVQTYSRQRRVVAVMVEESDRMLGKYSIPLDYHLKFCVKKGSAWKDNKRFSLSEIIEKGNLPVEVQFANDEKITVGSKSVSTSRFPALRLTRTFEEIYLLGNCINNGVMDPRYIPIPLYLKDLRLSLVTGIKGRTKEHWKSFQDELTSIANTSLKYDLNYGREDIAIYSNAAKDESFYEDLQPHVYADPFELLRYQTIEINPQHSLEEETIQSSALKTLKPNIQKPPAVPKKNKVSQDDPYISMSGDIPPALPTRNPKNLRRNVPRGKIHIEQLPSTSIRKTIPSTSDNALPDDIDQFTIKDVSEALKFLKLEKYIPEFANQMIDGRMLQGLDETILKEELHFTRIEALRLMNFAKYSHIPT